MANLKEQIKKDSMVEVKYLIKGIETSGAIFAHVTKKDNSGFYFKASKKSESRYVRYSQIGVENDLGVTVKVRLVK